MCFQDEQPWHPYQQPQFKGRELCQWKVPIVFRTWTHAIFGYQPQKWTISTYTGWKKARIPLDSPKHSGGKSQYNATKWTLCSSPWPQYCNCAFHVGLYPFTPVFLQHTILEINITPGPAMSSWAIVSNPGSLLVIFDPSGVYVTVPPIPPQP